MYHYNVKWVISWSGSIVQRKSGKLCVRDSCVLRLPRCVKNRTSMTFLSVGKSYQKCILATVTEHYCFVATVFPSFIEIQMRDVSKQP